MDVSRETAVLGDAWKDRLRRLLSSSTPPSRLDSLAKKLTVFAEDILDANEFLHLVSQRNPSTEVLKQIIDSAAVANYLSFCHGCRLLDVGSGAGFPGIILKLIFPEIELHTLDSSPRKIGFQKAACSRLEIEAVFHVADFRCMKLNDRADIVIVKALGSHADVLRRSKSWLGPLGKLIFMEGRVPEPAIESSVAKLNPYSHVTFLRYKLAEFDSERHLAIAYRK